MEVEQEADIPIHCEDLLHKAHRKKLFVLVCMQENFPEQCCPKVQYCSCFTLLLGMAACETGMGYSFPTLDSCALQKPLSVCTKLGLCHSEPLESENIFDMLVPVVEQFFQLLQGKALITPNGQTKVRTASLCQPCQI